MSALENYIKNKPLTGHLITLSTALICVFALWGLSRGNVREDNKITSLVNNVDSTLILGYYDLTQKLEKKADKVYVDSIMLNHQINDIYRYNRIDSLLFNIIDILKYDKNGN
jgi:hypothetical protein